MIGKWFARGCAVFFWSATCAPLWAQDTPISPGVRFMAPPAAGHAGPRITIQITPEEHLRNSNPPALDPIATRVTPSPDIGAERPDTGGTAWFWDAISPSFPPDPGRFWAAQDLLSSASAAADISVPRLNTLQQIVAEHGTAILGASIATEVSPALILAVMAVESVGRADAQSHAGAQGLMQLIPATAERFGVADPFDPAQNIAGGAAYLNWLLKEFDGDPLLALAGYNAGEGAVRTAGGVPNFSETRDYVPKVLAAWMMARGLCRTPPDLISDGCVFQPMAVQ